MSELIQERVCAEVAEPIVVFAIGMRLNRPWKVWQWLPIVRGMARMLKEQHADPSIGLLSTRPMIGPRNIAILQLWRSAGDLHAYAHDAGRNHLAEWRR